MPSSSSQFAHYLSLASSSKTDSQRRDALSYLTTQVSSLPVDRPLPLPTSILLPKLLPLILDGSSSVRTQLLKFLRLLPALDMEDRAEAALLYIRAGMTHLAVDIRVDALAVLEWLLEVAKEDVVACPGGWFKTLKSFMSMMGWATSSGTSKWTSASKATFGKAGKAFPRQILVLAKFLEAGLVEEEVVMEVNRFSMFPLVDVHLHMIPTRSNAFAHLNLFGPPRDEEGEMYMDRESRQRVFQKHFQAAVETGMANAKTEAGEAGRAAAVLAKVLKEGMADYSGVEDTQ